MTTKTDPDQGWVPEACTLPTVERPLRLAEFDDLFTGVQHVERVDVTRLRLILTGAAGLDVTVRDLAERENQCCSFFDFTVTEEGPGRVLFDIALPHVRVDVLDALATRAAGRGTR
jgi:hypothetical protein